MHKNWNTLSISKRILSLFLLVSLLVSSPYMIIAQADTEVQPTYVNGECKTISAINLAGNDFYYPK